MSNLLWNYISDNKIIFYAFIRLWLRDSKVDFYLVKVVLKNASKAFFVYWNAIVINFSAQSINLVGGGAMASQNVSRSYSIATSLRRVFLANGRLATNAQDQLQVRSLACVHVHSAKVIDQSIVFIFDHLYKIRNKSY